MKRPSLRRVTAGSRPERPRWYQTLGFRLGALLLGTILTFALLRGLLLGSLMPAVGIGDLEWSGSVVGSLLSVVLTLAIAMPVAYLLARRVTDRLARLSRSAAGSVERGELPGPFDASGNDEIALVAAIMNDQRKQMAERIKAFNLKDIRRREWIAQVSHDLRTPLTALIACLDRADLLAKADSSPRGKELAELLDVAKMDTDRVHMLADDLLEIARLEAGDRLYLEPVPPGELVRQAVRRLEPLAAQRGVQLEVRVTAGLPVLHADGRRLTRAIENLLRNAIQHARGKVQAIAMLSAEQVRFEVRDDGEGLPKQRDFLDYLRRRGSDVRVAELGKRRSRADSAGLGLVVAQRVAEAHDGHIDAYNLSTGGAAFWMGIPIDTRDAGDRDVESWGAPPERATAG